MADSFGVKMGVEGEREFKNALKDINAAFKVLGSEMNLVTSQFDKNDKSVQALTSSNAVLNKEIEAQKEKVQTLKAALDNASESFGENDKRTQNWQIQLNNAQAELNKMESELDKNNKALEESEAAFKDAGEEADDFEEEIEEAGKEAESSGSKFEKLGSILKGVGAAIGAAMAAVGTATVAAGKKLYDMANDAAAAGDEIDKMSQRLGLSREAYQEWDYVLSQSGVDINSVSTGMKTLTNSIDDAKNGSASAVEKFEKLGISIEDLEGKSREDIFAMTVTALQNMTDDTEKAALANDMFGRSGQEIMPLLNSEAAATDELRQKAHELGMVMSDEAVDAAVAYTDSMETLKRSFEGVKNNITSNLLPGFTMILDGLTGLITGQEGASEQLMAGAQETVNQITSILPQILTVVSSIIEAVAAVAPDLILALVNGIVSNLPSLIESASNIVTTLVNGLISALPQLTAGALQLVLTLTEGILSNLPSIVSAATEMIVTLATGLAEALPELIPSIVEAVILICSTLLSNMDKILEAAFSIISGLAQGLLNALPKLVAALPQIITSITNFITSNLPKIVEMGIKLIVQLAAGLIRAIPQLVASLPQIVTAIISGIGKAAVSIVDVGKNIVSGLWSGVSSMISWVQDKISGFVGNIVGGIKSLLGIHSPSRVFAGIGDNMAKGLGEGFTDEMDKVSKDINNSIPTDFDVDSRVNVGAAGGAGMGSGMVVTCTGPLVSVQQMIVRSEDDIRKVSQGLYNLMQSGTRAQGIIPIT